MFIPWMGVGCLLLKSTPQDRCSDRIVLGEKTLPASALTSTIDRFWEILFPTSHRKGESLELITEFTPISSQVIMVTVHLIDKETGISLPSYI